jgi:hypothetical protein
VGVFPPTPEEGNRSSFRNVVFPVPRISDGGNSPKEAKRPTGMYSKIGRIILKFISEI